MIMRTKYVLMVLGIAAFLAGCSSSDDNGSMVQMMAEQQEQEPIDVQMMPEEQEQEPIDVQMTAGLDGGLAQSPQSPVYAASDSDTLATLLPGGETVFSSLSATINLDYGMDRATQPDQGTAYVKSISPLCQHE